MRSQAGDQPGFGLGKSCGRLFTMAAQETPADAAGTECNPKLVAEPHRCHDLPVAGAAGTVVCGSPVESRGRRTPARQASKLVDVILEVLIREELRCRLRRDLPEHCSGEKQRRRVDRGTERRIDGKDPPQSCHDVVDERTGVDSDMASGHEIAHGTVDACSGHRHPPYVRPVSTAGGGQDAQLL